MYPFKTKLEPFGRGFVNCESSNKAKKIAAGLLNAAKEIPVKINLKTGLVSTPMTQATGFKCTASVFCELERMEEMMAQHPEDAADLLYIKEQMLPYLKHQTNLHDCYTPEQREHERIKDLWAGNWMGHSLPSYIVVANEGTDGLREKAETYRKANPGKDDFYDSICMTLDALDVFAQRIVLCAREMLETAAAQDQEKLQTIVNTFSHAPKTPCKDFAEATLVFYWLFDLDGIDSPGHFDQYMYDYWKVTDPKVRQFYLESGWEYLKDCDGIMNMCISGSDEHWNDLTNDLTYAILELAARKKYRTPNLTMRCHRNTPEKLRKMAYRSIATGCGVPVLYNDEAVCVALERLGIPPADSHQYSMNGCNQIDIQGKSHMGLEDGEVFFAKAVEYALFNGYSPYAGKDMALKTGDPCGFETYEAFYAAVLKQLDYLADVVTAKANNAQRLYAQEAPNPLRSCAIEGCIEKGLDYKQGGPIYGHGQILIQGIADTADALAAIKKYVYEEKRITMAQLIDALVHNFEGYEDIYQLLKYSELKYGNDIDYVDKIAADITEHFNRYLLTLETYRGGVYSGGCSPFVGSADYGAKLGAFPNGKKRGEYIIADSIGATPGCDQNGPTAMLNSCLKLDQTLPASGFVLNMKFDKELFNSPEGELGFLALWKSYFNRGGQQLSVTVVSADDLLDAKSHPDQHRDLIVRIGGYSARFVELSPELQDNVIARTCLCMR